LGKQSIEEVPETFNSQHMMETNNGQKLMLLTIVFVAAGTLGLIIGYMIRADNNNKVIQIIESGPPTEQLNNVERPENSKEDLGGYNSDWAPWAAWAPYGSHKHRARK